MRFALGWVLQDDTGTTYTTWPDNDADEDMDWVPPSPEILAKTLDSFDTTTFYHQVLPIFFSWPVFLDHSASPPSSFSNGYAWMRKLADWLAQPSVDPNALITDCQHRCKDLKECGVRRGYRGGDRSRHGDCQRKSVAMHHRNRQGGSTDSAGCLV